MIKPAQDILDYIERQPQMVQVPLYFAAAAGCTNDLWRYPNLASQAAQLALDPESPVLAFYRCLNAIGAIDFYWDSPVGRDIWEDIPVELLEGDQRLKMMALQAPLARRQREVAQADWLALRQGDLSFAALRALQASQMRAWLGIPEER